MGRPVAITIFCEDARAELAGSSTLVGVMSDRLAIDAFPAILPRLVAYTRIVSPISVRMKSLSTWLRFSDGREEGHQEFDTEFLEETMAGAKANSSTIVGIIGTLIAAPFVVPEELYIHAITCINGEEFISGYLGFAREPSSEKKLSE